MSIARPQGWGIRPVAVAFYLLAAATLVSFNGLSNMMFDTGWHVTLGLGLCCIFNCAVVRIPFGQCLGSPGFFILAALFSYLWVGGSVAMMAGTSLRHLLDEIVIARVALAALLIVAAALGAAATVRRVGADRLVLVVLYAQVACCIAMLMTPWLVEHIYSLSPRLWHVERHAGSRLLGTFVNPNDAGTVACLGAVTALAFLTCGRRVVVASLALVLSVAATALSFSRGAWLALAVFCLLSVPMFMRLVSRRVLVAGLALLVLAVVAVAALGAAPDFTARQLARLSVLNAASDIRLELLWPLALSHIAESPVVGHGITAGHAIVITDKCTASAYCGPHNVYLMLWREAGIVPLVLFMLFFVVMLCGGLKMPKSPPRNAVVGWTVVVAIACMLGHNVVYATHIAFIVGAGCALMCAIWRRPTV